MINNPQSDLYIKCEIQWYLNSSDTDGSFTMADLNSCLSPYEILPIVQEHKYSVKLFYHKIVCCVYTLDLPL